MLSLGAYGPPTTCLPPIKGRSLALTSSLDRGPCGSWWIPLDPARFTARPGAQGGLRRRTEVLHMPRHTNLKRLQQKNERRRARQRKRERDGAARQCSPARCAGLRTVVLLFDERGDLIGVLDT